MGGLRWDKFEEHGKVAFVQNAHGSRFFLKTTANKANTGHKNKKQSTLKVVARVSTHRQTEQEVTHHTSKFQTTNGTAATIARVTKFLRFAMQEVLGPMKSGGGVASPRSAIATAGVLPPTALLSLTMSPRAPASGTSNRKKKKNKRKGEKK